MQTHAENSFNFYAFCIGFLISALPRTIIALQFSTRFLLSLADRDADI